MKLSYLFCFASLGLTSLGVSQTVTVDPTLVSPNNSTTFSSLQLAIHSFQASGAVTASTNGSGVGVNHGNVAPNVINITSTETIDELVRIDERSDSAGYSVQDEDLTIAGPGNGAAASALNNAVVAVRDETGALVDDDGFEIRTDVDLTVKNVTFIPSPTLPPVDDLVTVDRVTASAGNPSSVTFESCIFTVYNAANRPVINSKAEALIDQAANVTTPAGAIDDLFDPFPDSGEGMIVSLIDCAMGQTKALGGAKDGIVEVAGGPRIDPFVLNIESTVISYCARYGIQWAGSGDPTDSNLWTCNIKGSNIGNGPVTGEGGPSVFLGSLRGIQSFLGANHGKVNISNTIASDNIERQLSMDFDVETSMSKTIANGPVPVVVEFDATQPNPDALWEDVTLRAVGAASLFGAQNGISATLNIRDSILAGDGSVPVAIGVFGAGDMQINIDYSAIVTQGPDAVLAVGGTTATTIGPNVINTDPMFVDRNPLLATFLDVTNCDYVDAAQDGGPLSGGADFVGICANVADWSMY